MPRGPEMLPLRSQADALVVVAMARMPATAAAVIVLFMSTSLMCVSGCRDGRPVGCDTREAKNPALLGFFEVQAFCDDA